MLNRIGEKLDKLSLMQMFSDFEELYRYLYDNASVYANGMEGMVAIYINEYSYQSNFRIDKEINAMALIQKLIELK